MATVTVRGIGNARTSPDEASLTLVIEAVEQSAAAARAAVELTEVLGIKPRGPCHD